MKVTKFAYVEHDENGIMFVHYSIVDYVQCDQIATLFLFNLAICSNEDLPNGINFRQSKFKILRNTKNLPNTFEILPRWVNFMQSGHTDYVRNFKRQLFCKMLLKQHK